MKTDVAVVGGGPGGSTLGSVLKTHRPDLSVAIFEREAFPRDHVGESGLPGIGAILDEIGVWPQVEAAGFPIKIGATYRWGVSDDLWDFHFLPNGEFTQRERPGRYEGERVRTAWQVDRAVYDKILLDHARELGCDVRERTAVAKVERTGDSVDGLTLASGERVEANHYVDASGHSGILRRAMGVGIEEPSALKNVAFWDYWRDAEWAVTVGSGTRVQVMSIGYGWLWFIPVSANRTSCGLVCPAEYYRRSGLRPEELYRRAIADEPRIRELLRHATPEGNFATTKDWSFIAERMAGENWFLVGESSGFADPILAAGLSLTQASAREAAYTILEIERSELPAATLKAMYGAVTERKIRRHIRFADYWYTANGHFRDLKEFTRDIAQDAGLDLSAEEAFQWLGTGGFLEDDTGRPGFAFFGLSALKNVANRLSEGKVGTRIAGCNRFVLKLEGAIQFETPRYENGRVIPVPACRRDGRILPLTGLYGRVAVALKHHAHFGKMAREVKEGIESQGGTYDRDTYVAMVNVLEAMARDGWVKPMRVAEGSPGVTFGSEDAATLFGTNRDGEKEVSVASS